MKVIDLLNKIANDEEVPKKVKYKTHYWEYKEEAKDYKDNEDDYVFSCSNYDITAMLDNEVEIIEEDKKIEKLMITSHCGGTFEEEQAFRNRRDDEITTRINEIIDYINKGDDKPWLR